MITLNDLTIGYNIKGHRHVVAETINADVRSGELTCLLGANGVGKSTLLRTLSSFQPKLDGSIIICGRQQENYTAAELARTIGVVLTDKPDVYNTTVREMVAMGRAPYTGFWGRCSDYDWQVVDHAMTQTGIASLAHRMTGTLSDGERQKVMIAKALAQETPVIFLDEPTAFLDYPSKVSMMLLLHRISHRMKKTVFLSTHDVELALQMADTVWLMGHGGHIVTGCPEDLALDGSLPQFFSSSGLTFDSHKGLFSPTFSTTRTLRLTGPSGQRMAMVSKALLRNGIATVTDSDAADTGLSPDSGETTVDVGPDVFTVRNGSTCRSHKSISGLLADIINANLST